MGLLGLCQELFYSTNLYDVLSVSKEATDAEIRRSYYKLSLSVHPDRAPEDPLSKEKFQVLGKLYALLTDREQRALYDEQGLVDEESDAHTQVRCWEDYWRTLFPKITVRDIKEFERKYKGSEEERQDVMRLYLQHAGNMDAIMASTLCCSQEEEPRISGVIHAAIQSGELPALATFTRESDGRKKARAAKADKERLEAEEMQREMGLGVEGDSLVRMLKQRQQSREQHSQSFLSDLETKYSKKGGKENILKGGKIGKK